MRAGAADCQLGWIRRATWLRQEALTGVEVAGEVLSFDGNGEGENWMGCQLAGVKAAWRLSASL